MKREKFTKGEFSARHPNTFRSEFDDRATEIGFVMEEEENGQCMFYFICLRKAGLISVNFN